MPRCTNKYSTPNKRWWHPGKTTTTPMKKSSKVENNSPLRSDNHEQGSHSARPSHLHFPGLGMQIFFFFFFLISLVTYLQAYFSIALIILANITKRLTKMIKADGGWASEMVMVGKKERRRVKVAVMRDVCDNGWKVSTVGHLGESHKACHYVRLETMPTCKHVELPPNKCRRIWWPPGRRTAKSIMKRSIVRKEKVYWSDYFTQRSHSARPWRPDGRGLGVRKWMPS